MGTAKRKSPINRSVLRDRALALAAELRPAAAFKRVGRSLYADAEAYLDEWLRDRIQRHPTNGKTLR